MESVQLIYDAHGPYLWLASVALFVLLLAVVGLLNMRLSSALRHYKRLTRGVAAGSFDEVLARHLQRLEETAHKVDDISGLCDKLGASVKESLQRVGVVRFNPFADVGGDQSFAVALLDAKGDGLVISSLFGRNESRVYAKPIQGGQSKYALSAEEAEALRLAERQPAAQRSR